MISLQLPEVFLTYEYSLAKCLIVAGKAVAKNTNKQMAKTLTRSPIVGGNEGATSTTSQSMKFICDWKFSKALTIP